jgi:hypothetical protein
MSHGAAMATADSLRRLAAMIEDGKTVVSGGIAIQSHGTKTTVDSDLVFDFDSRVLVSRDAAPLTFPLCEVCGEQAVCEVTDLVKEDSGTGMIVAKPHGDPHYYCKAHERDSETYEAY